jgi:hypothetical protein
MKVADDSSNLPKGRGTSCPPLGRTRADDLPVDDERKIGL